MGDYESSESDLRLIRHAFFLQDFTDRYEGRYRDVQLPLSCVSPDDDLPADRPL
jgi:hypothetical protein